MTAERYDPHSASNFNSFITKHLHLDWDVDFEEKCISGSVLLTIHSAKSLGHQSKRIPVDSLILDTKDLLIKSVLYLADGDKKECQVRVISTNMSSIPRTIRQINFLTLSAFNYPNTPRVMYLTF